MSCPHKTRAIKVWADIDAGIADLVEYLNTIPGVRTYAMTEAKRASVTLELERRGIMGPGKRLYEQYRAAQLQAEACS